METDDYSKLEAKMDKIEERLIAVEKDIVDIKSCISDSLTGERSVWSALDRLIEEFTKFRESSEKDRKEIRLDVVKMTATYESVSWIIKALGVTVIGAVISTVVGLLTHTIVFN
jgi:hypothetical protein